MLGCFCSVFVRLFAFPPVSVICRATRLRSVCIPSMVVFDDSSS